MITPMTLDLVLKRNDNPFRVLIAIENDDGSTMNMSGHTAKAAIRLYPGAEGDPLLSALSTAFTGTHIDLSADGIEMVISKTAIATLPPPPAGREATFVWDMLIKPPGGDENAWIEGSVTYKYGVVA